MYQILVRVASRYAPIVTIPVAVVLGFIGYSIESAVSSRKTPALDKGISQIRQERLLREIEGGVGGKEAEDVAKMPTTIFERNNSAELK